MDADDIAEPGRLAAELRWLGDHRLDVCGGQVVRFGERPGSVWYPQSHQAIAHELLFRSALSNPALLARAEVLKAVRFNEFECAEEYDLMTRLVGAWRLGNCPDVVLRLRGHPAQTTRRLSKRKRESRQRQLFNYFFRCFPHASLADFRCLFALRIETPFAEAADLERAGDWLVRLSRLPEPRLRQRMARRWAWACDAYAGLAGDVATLRGDYADRILAAP
jgi:hypothetical protein